MVVSVHVVGNPDLQNRNLLRMVVGRLGEDQASHETRAWCQDFAANDLATALHLSIVGRHRHLCTLLTHLHR